MKTILVPTDFSEAASNAAVYAVNLAKEIKAQVCLLHIYQLPIPISEVPVMVISPDELQNLIEIRLKKEVEQLMKKSVVVVNYLVKTGSAVSEILKEEKNANLIVMGMKGAGKLSEVLMGSVTTTTLRKAKIPVLVIPENAKYKKPEKIVFACDYDSRTDMHILKVLKDFIKGYGSQLYVLNVKQRNEPVSVEEAMLSMRVDNKLNDVEHFYCFPEKDDLVEGINKFVEDHKADMVAIIPHRYSLMEYLFHKSISKKMAFHTHVPLLALPDNHKSIPAYFL